MGSGRSGIGGVLADNGDVAIDVGEWWTSSAGGVHVEFTDYIELDPALHDDGRHRFFLTDQQARELAALLLRGAESSEPASTEEPARTEEPPF